MCAMVASTPVILTLPLTDLSAAMVIVPVPDAAVVTGGVSSAPVNFIFTSAAEADAMLIANTAAASSARIRCVWKNMLIVHSWMILARKFPLPLFVRWGVLGRRRRWLAGTPP